MIMAKGKKTSQYSLQLCPLHIAEAGQILGQPCWVSVCGWIWSAGGCWPECTQQRGQQLRVCRGQLSWPLLDNSWPYLVRSTPPLSLRFHTACNVKHFWEKVSINSVSDYDVNDLILYIPRCKELNASSCKAPTLVWHFQSIWEASFCNVNLFQTN